MKTLIPLIAILAKSHSTDLFDESDGTLANYNSHFFAYSDPDDPGDPGDPSYPGGRFFFR